MSVGDIRSLLVQLNKKSSLILCWMTEIYTNIEWQKQYDKFAWSSQLYAHFHLLREKLSSSWPENYIPRALFN